MNSFQMASYSIKRCSLSSRSLVIFLLLVACFEKQFEVSSIDPTADPTTDVPTNTTTQQPPASSSDTMSTAPTVTTTKAPINGTCTTNENCSVGFCDSNKCKCINTEFYNGSSCVNKPNHGESCNSSTNNCLDNSTVCRSAKNTSYLCLCRENTFRELNQCQPASLLNVTGLTGTSTEDTVNISWTPFTNRNVNYRITIKDQQINLNFTSNTSATINGLQGDTLYIITVTTVLPGDGSLYGEITTSVNIDIKTKIAYGSQCKVNDLTQSCVLGTNCTKDKSEIDRCLCKSSEYRSKDAKCLRIETVSPSAQRNTTFISFTWSLINQNNFGIKYYISVGNNETSADETNGVVSGLTPGSHYEIQFITRVPEDQYYSIRNVTYNKTYWTTPAKPEGMKSDAFSDSKAYFTISPSRGNVSHYTVSINVNIETEIQSTENTSIVFFKLAPATNYQYTIFATNGFNDASERLTGIVTTHPISSGIVNNLKAENLTADSAWVKWQKPLNSNGNITGYVAYIENDKCEARYIIMCSDCSSEGNITLKDCGLSHNLSYASVTLENSSYIIELQLENLKPYKNYSVEVFPFNVVGQGMMSDVHFQTKEGLPYPVTSIKLSPTRSSSKTVGLNVSWEHGEFTGLTNYRICLQEEQSLSVGLYNNISCQNTEGFENTFTNFTNLLGFWKYIVTIQASTKAGNSDEQNKTGQTATKEPGVANFSLSQDDTFANKIFITISCPEERERNGIIKGFTIRKHISGLNETFQNTTTDSCSKSSTFALSSITVEKNYSVQVLTFNEEFQGPYSKEQQQYVYPKSPLLDTVRESLKKTDISSETEIVVEVVPKYLKEVSQGKVNMSGILVCIETEKSNCFSQSRKKKSTKDEESYHITWSKAKESNFNIQYRTTPDNWLDNENAPFKYHIGSEETCKKEYCNGPLPSDKKIKVKVIVCTGGGCQIFIIDGLATKAPTSNVGAIVGGVVGGILGLAVIAAVVGLFIWYKRRPRPSRPTSPFWHMDSESRKREHIKEQRPIKIYEFKEHVIRLHKDSNLLFQDEFEDIKKLSARFTHTSEKAKEESNRVKNRYVDILPYDHSRVKLDIQPEDDDSMDFINANYIPGYNSVREYIATQGPMHYTIPDFWRMTWEQKSKVIVMLSDLQEQGKRKVDLYWPENLNEPINYGNIIVEMTNFSQLNKYIIRNFKITRGSDTRRVTHFFLPGWWDFSANLTTEDVLEFAKLVRQEATPANSGPIIVHCSAGVGRTGTFIALDYFMQYIDKHSLMDSVDIFSYVMKMRYNRPRMVQAETQYIFIFDALEEIITKKIKDEEEKMAEHTFGNGNIYANVTAKQPEESIYANSEPVKDKNAYDNQAFEMEYQNMDLSQSKKDNPTTVL